MASVPRPKLTAIADSPYAAELQRGTQNRCFDLKLEAEYVRARLLGNRALIRVACVLAVLLVGFRGLEQVTGSSWNSTHVLQIGFVLAASIALALIAWSQIFTRLYLPFAQIVVPIRNSIAAAAIAASAAHGQLELLIVLPLMVLGPFFFLGLGFRAALISVALTVATYTACATVFELTLSVTLHSCAFLLIAAIACAIAAHQLESSSRANFLNGRLIADLAQHDPLTGMKNRRVFDEHLSRLWQQATEDRRAIAILLVDVDHFKAYNDRYGHQAGDETLRRIAQTLERFVYRPLDVLARYGGEEFGAVLYDIDAHEATEVAGRMRRGVSELAIEHKGSRISPVVTISLGIAVIEPSADRKPRGALQLADEALYEAKVRGRNRVELMDEAQYRMLVTGVFSRSSFAR